MKVRFCSPFYTLTFHGILGMGVGCGENPVKSEIMLGNSSAMSQWENGKPTLFIIGTNWRW